MSLVTSAATTLSGVPLGLGGDVFDAGVVVEEIDDFFVEDGFHDFPEAAAKDFIKRKVAEPLGA